MLVLLAVVAPVAIGGWSAREWLLCAAADRWIVSDPPGPADAVAIFGGGVADRPFAAAQYYKQSLVTKILVDDPDSKTVLLKIGVPASAIETFGYNLKNTHQEALALRAWAEQTKTHSIIVPTEIFSARRVRWTLHRVLSPGTSIRVPALVPPDYGRADWWQNDGGMFAFQNELLKYLYYRIRY
jgi:uncharacterized SAM-binding protein YcdF (DUF218 family)